MSSLFCSSTLTFAAPTGGNVTSGAATIIQNGNITNINQTTNKATINWQSFSLSQNEIVNFNQPNANAITLNRVVGNERSVINGALNANGQVWILNSNGVLFGKNASINTSGLLATTAKLSDDDFNVGNYNFKNTTANSIINQGTIEISNKGSVILASNEVINEGTIKAVRGNIHLVGADSYSINLNGNSLVDLRVDKGVLDAMVSNSGTILADGGEVYLTTNAVDELLKGVVNNSGIIEANSIDDVTGHVEIFAHGGEALVDGIISAEGGFIETSAKKIKFSDTLALNAGFGGTWLIDPNNIRIVSDAIAEANVDSSGAPLYTSLDDTTILRASTIEAQLNNGTNVIIETGESGTNSQDGDIFLQTSINKTSGADATLTLKAHRNIFFADDYQSPTAFGSISSTSNRLNVVLWSDSDGNSDGSIWLPEGSSISSNGGHVWLGGGAGSSTWNGLTVGNSSAVGSSFSSSEGNAISRGVSINGNIFADGDSFGGDIFIKGLASTSSHFTSARGVSISGSVTTNYNGNISIEGKAKSSSDAIGIGDTSSALADGSAILRVNNGTIFINGYSNQGNTSSDSFYLNNGSYIESTGTGTLIIDGNDDEISADSTSYIKIANLLLKNGFTTTLTNSNNDIKTLAATGMTSLTYSDSNDITIGTINGVDGITVNGDVELQANEDITVDSNITWATSNKLTLTAGDEIYVNAIIENTNSTDGGVYFNAANTTGKVIFGANGKVVINNINQLQWVNQALNGKYELGSDIDASATSTWNSGAGWNPLSTFTGTFDGKGHIIDSLYINRATANIGLFGYTNGATISNIGLTNVDITGGTYTGALVGYNDNSVINNSYSSGAVNSSGHNVGGLVGINMGSNSEINYSYSSANIIANGNSNDRIGGLVGWNYMGASIKNSYAAGSVSGDLGTGGLLGSNESGSKVENSYSTGTVTGLNDKGGLVGWSNATVSNSFWDTQKSGQSSSAGGTGLTTAQMSYGKYFFDAGWDIVADSNVTSATPILKYDAINNKYVWAVAPIKNTTVPENTQSKDNKVEDTIPSIIKTVKPSIPSDPKEEFIELKIQEKPNKSITSIDEVLGGLKPKNKLTENSINDEQTKKFAENKIEQKGLTTNKEQSSSSGEFKNSNITNNNPSITLSTSAVEIETELNENLTASNGNESLEKDEKKVIAEQNKESSKQASQENIKLNDAQIEMSVDGNGNIVESRSKIEVKVNKNGKLAFGDNSSDVLETMGLAIKDIAIRKNRIKIDILDKKANTNYSASLEEGTPLISDLVINTKTGKIRGTLPKNASEVSVLVKAISEDKTARFISLKIKLDSLKSNIN
ncbi:two-partner secretion domain-containing protein [Halarcobacter ebronensis]|uniref:two-partner secretion domain-containing protein n=1 Tax=Halarcobacter ebronensis TaxID=1462615 RepID=UPI0013E94AA0|nr:filamentous hemagglutinin N-terminal domain-containing protein [Halarcobacter ebronensis]